jgi:hypothetical protein
MRVLPGMMDAIDNSALPAKASSLPRETKFDRNKTAKEFLDFIEC